MDGFGTPPPVVVIEELEDGGVELQTPAIRRARGEIEGFDENLALREDVDLPAIAEEVLDGVDWDLRSRDGFVENYTAGLDLLGLEIKEEANAKTSQIGHPLLLASVIKAQSAAGAELMPAGGPCKVDVSGGSTAALDELAQAFQDDINTYLVKAAPEYYPDMDRGLFGLFYGGNLIKKVYHHPLRRRPVSESVPIEDFIVGEDATDIETALRYTHRSEMTPIQVRRMQRFADWRDVRLQQGLPIDDPIRLRQRQTTGASGAFQRPQDLPHEIYETTVDLDLSDFGMELPDAPDIPVSYIVTMDKVSREVLALRRGWREGDEQFQRRQRFVHYGMIPAFGFLNLGFVHLLGNSTKALRGVWRVLLTQGMYANAPGGMKIKGVKSTIDNARPGPGEWIDMDIAGMDDIRKALMPMPYKDVSPAFMELAEMVKRDAMSMAGTAEIEVGEGRTNVPVGTMMSMIEVATQVMAAVHKRLHRAQARELQLIKELFHDNPEALWQLSPDPRNKWRERAQFENFRLIPASDPNTPSQIHRIQLATALITVASQNPDLYDRIAAHKRAWKAIGVDDAEAFVLPQPMPPPPPPGKAPESPLIAQAKLLEAQAKMVQAQQSVTDGQRKAAAELEENAQQVEVQRMEAEAKLADIAARQQIAQMQVEMEAMRLAVERMQAERQMETDREIAELQAETAREVADVRAEADKHKAKVQADTQKAVARSRPKPKASK